MATENDLIEALSKKISYLSKEDSSEVVNLVLEYLTTTLVQHNRVDIRGFFGLAVFQYLVESMQTLINCIIQFTIVWQKMSWIQQNNHT